MSNILHHAKYQKLWRKWDKKYQKKKIVGKMGQKVPKIVVGKSLGWVWLCLHAHMFLSLEEAWGL